MSYMETLREEIVDLTGSTTPGIGLVFEFNSIQIGIFNEQVE